MKTSESIIKIAPALLSAQKKIGAASKDAVNPFFHSKYADLGAVMEACKDALNENEILALQPIMGEFVETVLLHSSGEWIASSTPITAKVASDPQAMGSAITYARRYGLQSMLFIPAEDDDAEKATNHKPSVASPKPLQEEKICSAHEDPIPMKYATSKSTGKGYWGHRNADGQVCFGQGYQG